MKTVNDIYESKAMKEVLQWKEEASEATKDMSFVQLKAHYSETLKKAAALIGAKLIQTESGTFKLARE